MKKFFFILLVLSFYYTTIYGQIQGVDENRIITTSLTAGYCNTHDDAVGNVKNIGLRFSAISSIFLFEGNCSMGYGKKFRVLDYFNVDIGFGHVFNLNDDNKLAIGMSPLAINLNTFNPFLGISFLAKYVYKNVILEYKFYPKAYGESTDLRMFERYQYGAIHYFIDEQNGLGLRITSFGKKDGESNSSHIIDFSLVYSFYIQ